MVSRSPPGPVSNDAAASARELHAGRYDVVHTAVFRLAKSSLNPMLVSGPSPSALMDDSVTDTADSSNRGDAKP
jgi:hypothetical protein